MKRVLITGAGSYIGTKVEEEDGGDKHNIDQKAGEEANITRHLRRPRFFRDYPLAVRHRF